MSDEEFALSGKRSELHPAYLAARAQIDIQEGTARNARAALWPEISIQNRRQLDGVQFDPSNDATLLVVSFQSNNVVQGLFGYKARSEEHTSELPSLMRISYAVFFLKKKTYST